MQLVSPPRSVCINSMHAPRWLRGPHASAPLCTGGVRGLNQFYMFNESRVNAHDSYGGWIINNINLVKCEKSFFAWYSIDVLHINIFNGMQ